MNIFKSALLFGCIFSACAKPPPHAKHAQDTALAFTEIVCKNEGLKSLGSGGFYKNKMIESLYIDFEMTKKVLPEEAKALLTRTVDEFINFINENEKIRPYLETWPVTSKQISTSIAFIDDKRSPLSELSQIHLYQGVVYYSTYIPEKKEYSSYEQELYSNN